jgi:hypothetical protein
MKSPNFSWRLVALGVVGLAFFAAIGCSSQKKSLPREESGLKKLTVFYCRFLAQHGGQPPANEVEFKKFVQSLTAPDSAAPDSTASGADNSDKIFISNRDGKPYVILYGQTQGPPGPGGSPLIAYEQDGKDGKRWVASALGAVEEVDEAHFREMVPAKP